MVQQHWMVCSWSHPALNVIVHAKIKYIWSGPAFQWNWAYYTKLIPDLIPQCHSDYKGRHRLSPEALELYTSNLGQPKQIPCRFLFENLTLPLAEWLDSSLSHPAWVMDPAVSSLVKTMSSPRTHSLVLVFGSCFVLFGGYKLTHTHCGENSRKDMEPSCVVVALHVLLLDNKPI